MANEIINHPAHYTSGKIECIDYIEAQGFDFNLGNVVKYVTRAGKKKNNTRLQDLEKAQWYLNREIARELAVQEILAKKKQEATQCK